MMKFFLVRNLYAQDGGEIWHSSPVADELEVYLKICQENWHGNFMIIPEDKMPSCRARFKKLDWQTHFKSPSS
jgi:hypothetical protein